MKTPRPRQPSAPLPALVSAACLVTACTLTPSAVPVSARGLGAGVTAVSGAGLPALGAGVSRGVTDALDVGLSAELQGTAALWGKYTVVDRPGVAVAVEGRVVAGFDETVAEASGLGVGPMIELGAGRTRLLAGLRFTELVHETYDPEDGGGFFSTDLRPEPGQNYGRIVSLHAALAFGNPGRNALHLGAACDFFVALDTDVRDSDGELPDGQRCYPLLGLTVPFGG